MSSGMLDMYLRTISSSTVTECSMDKVFCVWKVGMKNHTFNIQRLKK